MALSEFLQITGDVPGLPTTPIPLILAVLQQRSDSLKEARAEMERRSGTPPGGIQAPGAAPPDFRNLGKPGHTSRGSVSFQDLVSDKNIQGNLLSLINSHKGKMKG